MKHKQPWIVRFFLGLVSFALCIVLFVTTIATIVIADVRLLTNGDMLQKLISQALTASITGGSSSQVPVGAVTPMLSAGNMAGGLAGLIPGDLSGILSEELPGNESELSKWIYDTMKDQFGEDLPITYDQISTFVEESTVTDFLAEKVSSIATDIFTGQGSTTITVEEVETLLKDNQQLIQDCFGVEVKDEHIEQMVEQIEESKVLEQINSETIRETIGMSGESTSILDGGMPTLPNIMATINQVTSMAVLMSAIGACLVLVLLIFLCNWGRVYKAMSGVGWTWMLASLLFALLSGTAYAAPSVFAAMGILGQSLQAVLKLIGWVAFSVFGAGFILAFSSIFVKISYRRKWRAAMAAAAAPAPVPVAVAVETAPVYEAAVQEVAQEETPVAEPAAETPAEEPAAEATTEETVEETTEEAPKAETEATPE